MKKFILTTLLFSLIISVTLAQDGSGTIAKTGDSAPSFKCMTIDGKTIDTKELTGKVIWVNFFATWCPPCLKELPVLQKEVYEKYSNNSDFVLVVLGREHNETELKEFAEERGLDLPFAPDMEREIFSKYAENSIPRNVIIGKDGKISFQSIGYTPEEFKKLEEKLAELLK